MRVRYSDHEQKMGEMQTLRQTNRTPCAAAKHESEGLNMTMEQLVGRDEMWDTGKACCTCDESRAYTGEKVWCCLHPGLRHRQYPACPDYKGPMPPTRDLIEWAWGIIANAGGGDWDKETAEWRETAGKWRDAFLATKTANAQLDRQEDAK